MNFCPDCGARRLEGLFCGECGAALDVPAVQKSEGNDAVRPLLAVAERRAGAQPAASGETFARDVSQESRDDSRGPGPVGSPDRTLRLGRDADNDVVLTDPSASRWHARIESGSRARITDLASFRGTRVNGEHVYGSRPLAEGDEITIGNQRLVWRNGEVTAAVSPSGTATLTAEHLGVLAKGSKVLLNDVSLTFAPGSLTAVIGPSGAGKSTLLGALTGLRPATHGTVTYLGADLYEQYEDLKLRIGFVPQQEIQHHQLTVRQALGFSAALRLPPDTSAEERASRVADVVETLQLTARVDNRIGTQLSGGQRKRVSIATELLTAPPVMFLDEPTSGLDPGLDIELMGHLRALADDGRVVVVVTHSVLSLDVCDTVVALAPGGRLAYAGPPRGLLETFGCSSYPQIFEKLEHTHHATPELPGPADQRSSLEVERDELVRSAKRLPFAGIARDVREVQFRTLVARNVAVLAADRVLTTMLVAMPVLLGLGCRLVGGTAGLSLLQAPTGIGGVLSSDQASKRLTILVLSAVLMGTALSIRAVVGERPIFQREYAAGLAPDLYMSSKIAVLGTAAAAQGVVVTFIATAFAPGPDYGGDLHLGRLEVVAAMALLAAASAVLGLAISALLSNTEQAMPALVGVVMIQLLLSGSIISVIGRPTLQIPSWFVPARWAYAAASSSTSLQRPLRQQGAGVDGLAVHGFGHLALAVLMLCLLALGAGWCGILATRRLASRRTT